MPRGAEILRVKSAVVVITRQGPMGAVLNYAYQNELLFPGDGTPRERERGLRKGMLEVVPAEEAAPAVASREQAETAPAVDDLGGEEPTPGTGDADDADDTGKNPMADAVAYDDPERVAAREKLPAEGLPHPNAGQPVWVEAAVANGYAYNMVRGEEKSAIRTMLENAN